MYSSHLLPSRQLWLTYISGFQDIFLRVTFFDFLTEVFISASLFANNANKERDTRTEALTLSSPKQLRAQVASSKLLTAFTHDVIVSAE